MPRGEVERFCKGRFASRDGLITFGLAILGPYYSTYDVTRADLALAREFDLFASMHVGGGTGGCVGCDGGRCSILRYCTHPLTSDRA